MDAEFEGRPSTATNSEISTRVNACIFANRHTTIDEMSNEMDISYGIVRKIIADQFHKVCAGWVPRLLTEEHKRKRFESAFAFSQCYQKERNDNAIKHNCD
ncbi:histone-lysine N-methyltransferase SETMAR [Nephila pilipes]|uniref:Histone-lysine N-methyltransferase SETMAR n=1 Tax=Nephila pilipes TaxID=299642 RepID=A0A8X6M891_NEPPI|nr:histone-lysine N-methyltransferase SETMAR [Nephila pilipes]